MTRGSHNNRHMPKTGRKGTMNMMLNKRNMPVRSIVCLTALTLVIGVLGACDQQAAEVREVQAQLDKAMSTIDRAQRGFADPDATNPKRVESYRQQTLAQAVTPLEAVIASPGAAQAQINSARSLLADIYAASARDRLRRAKGQFGGIQNRAAAMSTYVLAASSAVNRQSIYQHAGDKETSPLSSAEAQANQSVQSLKNQQLQDLQTQRSKLAAERDAKMATARSNQQQSAELRLKAANLTGKAHYDTLEKALELERKALSAGFDADQLQAQIDTLDQEIALTELKISLTEHEAKRLAERTAAVEDGQSKLDAGQSDASAEKSDALSQLDKSFKALQAVYVKTVDEPMTAAVADADKARQLIEEVASSATRSVGNTIETELLAKRLDEVNVLTQYIVMLSGWSNTLKVLADEAAKISAPQAQDLAQVAKASSDKQAKLAELATNALAAADELAAKVHSSSEQLAAKQQEIIASYRKQLGEIQ